MYASQSPMFHMFHMFTDISIYQYHRYINILVYPTPENTPFFQFYQLAPTTIVR
jgi:hypothetical protein